MSALSDPISDMLARLRNSTNARQTECVMPYSKIKSEIARILKSEGYITNYELDTSGKFPQLKITNKYVNKSAAITGLKRVSKPGLRKYVGSQDIPRVLGGMGIAVLSTSRGVLTGHDARRQKVGGELLAMVW